MSESPLSSMSFSAASAFWFEQYSRYIKNSEELRLRAEGTASVLRRDCSSRHHHSAQAVERANGIGSRYREEFLFPYRINRAKWDPTRPASKGWLRKQTAKLREATGVIVLSTSVWRNQLCKEMLEQDVPTDSVVGVLGRVSDKMLKAYKHTILAAKQEALRAVKSNLIAFPGER
jgi:hypothetical protein